MAYILVSVKICFLGCGVHYDQLPSRHPLCLASIPKNALAMRRMSMPYLYVGFDDDTTMSK